MTNLVAIDTSTEACTVGLLFQEKIFSKTYVKANHHATVILPMLDALLQEAGCKLSAMQAIAVGNGPGSFTGLRIGVSVAQGLAFGISVPIIPVSSLQILAQTAYRQQGIRKVIVTLDARMHEIYVGRYECVDDVMQPTVPDALLLPAALQQDTPMVGPGLPALGYAPDTLLPDAIDLLTLAEKLYQNRQWIDPSQVQINYLRNEVVHQK